MLLDTERRCHWRLGCILAACGTCTGAHRPINCCGTRAASCTLQQLLRRQLCVHCVSQSAGLLEFGDASRPAQHAPPPALLQAAPAAAARHRCPSRCCCRRRCQSPLRRRCQRRWRFPRQRCHWSGRRLRRAGLQMSAAWAARPPPTTCTNGKETEVFWVRLSGTRGGVRGSGGGAAASAHLRRRLGSVMHRPSTTRSLSS